MISLLVLTLLLVAAGAVLVTEMLRRDSPIHGVVGLALMIVAGIPATVYGTLSGI